MCQPWFLAHWQVRLYGKRQKRPVKNSNDSPVSSRNSPRSSRIPAETAVLPLVPGAPWPLCILESRGRRGKSVSPYKAEKSIFTPPMTKEVEVQGVQAWQSQSQILEHSSPRSALPHTQSGRPTRGANIPTISAILHLSEEYTPGSYVGNLSLLGDNGLHLGCSRDNSISCIQQNGARMCNCVRDETQFRAHVRVPVCLRAVSINRAT